MTDNEIRLYLKSKNYAVNAQDGINDILNTSPQIVSTEYDFDKNEMTLYTIDTTFVFQWVLYKIS